MEPVADHGFAIRRFATVSSTMTIAADIAATEPHVDRLWVIAAEQTGGRGRLGRVWISPRGNLHATLILRDPCAPRDLPRLGFAAGVALARCLRAFVDDPRRVTLKWPNDLLLDGAKVAGILMENAGASGALIGIGANLCSAPDGLPYATACLERAGAFADVDAVLACLSREMAVALARFDHGHGFSSIREEWLELTIPIGAPLRLSGDVATGQPERTGFFAGLDALGRLLLERDGRIEQHSAADVVALPIPVSASA